MRRRYSQQKCKANKAALIVCLCLLERRQDRRIGIVTCSTEWQLDMRSM